MIARAREHFGDAPIKSVRFPGVHGRVVSVFFVDVGNSRPRATDQIMLNGYTGEPLGVYDATTSPAASRVLDWALPIHTGEFLGLPGRLLFLVAAFALQMLALTGFVQWWQRRQRRRAATNAVTGP
jgi:sulfite reductase (NADPH) flavoprotein alpha-component